MNAKNKLIVKKRCNHQRVDAERILYIRVKDYCLTFYAMDGEQFTCVKSLTKLEEELPDCFFRISRSCLINLNAVQGIDVRKRELLFINQQRFTVAHRRMKPQCNRFDNLVSQKQKANRQSPNAKSQRLTTLILECGTNRKGAMEKGRMGDSDPERSRLETEKRLY